MVWRNCSISNGSNRNLHNHKIHGSNKIAQCIKEKINNAISANPALTPSEIAYGKGIGFIPSAVDQASSYTRKVSQEIKKTERNDKNWSPMNFEETVSEFDEEDDQIAKWLLIRQINTSSMEDHI